jgi:hypothetical protein
MVGDLILILIPAIPAHGEEEKTHDKNSGRPLLFQTPLTLSDFYVDQAWHPAIARWIRIVLRKAMLDVDLYLKKVFFFCTSAARFFYSDDAKRMTISSRNVWFQHTFLHHFYTENALFIRSTTNLRIQTAPFFRQNKQLHLI